jgi:hypothetical protein
MPRSTCAALFLAVIVGTVAPKVRAQTCGANAQSTIATDRPQITSSSIVVPCGSLQFENGFQDTSNGGQQAFDFPETAVRLGIASKTELRFGVPDYFYNYDTAPPFGNGFSDLSLGFKQQLGPTRGGFDVSLIPSVRWLRMSVTPCCSLIVFPVSVSHALARFLPLDRLKNCFFRCMRRHAAHVDPFDSG